MPKDGFWRHTDHETSIYSMRMHQNLSFFMKKRPKMAFCWSKIEFFSFRYAVEDPSPLF